MSIASIRASVLSINAGCIMLARFVRIMKVSQSPSSARQGEEQ
jgi:hypothetical protein